MNDEKLTEQNVEDIPENKKGFIAWIKEHKVQLIFAGIGITTLIATVLGLKNKETIIDLWDSLKVKIEKGSLYSGKWFKNADLEELQDLRNTLHQTYLNPELDMDDRIKCRGYLDDLDKIISKRESTGKEYDFPAHSENGWYLLSDD